jgi:hypothetical protein
MRKTKKKNEENKGEIEIFKSTIVQKPEKGEKYASGVNIGTSKAKAEDIFCAGEGVDF